MHFVQPFHLCERCLHVDLIVVVSAIKREEDDYGA
jgi:hypothetical protein